mmetsp:Transcript_50731/g.94820  ORF Transcript_50731/g.94820 Transcript_50731/m.94820 type:complete len:256 (+) Transcript_50731:564-1331(+)
MQTVFTVVQVDAIITDPPTVLQKHVAQAVWHPNSVGVHLHQPARALELHVLHYLPIQAKEDPEVQGCDELSSKLAHHGVVNAPRDDPWHQLHNFAAVERIAVAFEDSSPHFILKRHEVLLVAEGEEEHDAVHRRRLLARNSRIGTTTEAACVIPGAFFAVAHGRGARRTRLCDLTNLHRSAALQVGVVVYDGIQRPWHRPTRHIHAGLAGGRVQDCLAVQRWKLRAIERRYGQVVKILVLVGPPKPSRVGTARKA